MSGLTLLLGGPMHDDEEDLGSEHEAHTANLGVKFTQRFLDAVSRKDAEDAWACFCRMQALADDDEEHDGHDESEGSSLDDEKDDLSKDY